MIYNEAVGASDRLREIERNNGLVYFRFNMRKIESEDRQGYTFDQYVLTEDEYEDVKSGRVSDWTDGLRAIQRSALYDVADQHIIKYSTDVDDEGMRAKWVKFKRLVRATPSQEQYPAIVEYPARPE